MVFAEEAERTLLLELERRMLLLEPGGGAAHWRRCEHTAGMLAGCPQQALFTREEYHAAVLPHG